MVVDLLAEGDMEFGVIPFDELQRNQKLLALYKSRVDCFVRMNQRRSSSPSSSPQLRSSTSMRRNKFTRKLTSQTLLQRLHFGAGLVLDAVSEQIAPEELPNDTNRDKETWTILVECLAGCVLWDNDYESQESFDLPPEESRKFRSLLGMADDYYTDVPPDPPDDQANLYIDALMGLTADAR